MGQYGALVYGLASERRRGLVFAENFVDAASMARNGYDAGASTGPFPIKDGIQVNSSTPRVVYDRQELRNPLMATLNKLSIFCYVDLSFLSGAYQPVFTSYSTTTGVQFGVDNTASTSAKKLWLWLDNNSYVSSTTTATTTGWIGATWGSSAVKFWVNGVQLGTSVATVASLTNRYLYDMYLGSDQAGVHCNGWLRRVRLYRDELLYGGAGCYA